MKKALQYLLLLTFLQAFVTSLAFAQAVVEYVGVTRAVTDAIPAVGRSVQSITSAAVEKLLAQPQTVDFMTPPPAAPSQQAPRQQPAQLKKSKSETTSSSK